LEKFADTKSVVRHRLDGKQSTKLGRPVSLPDPEIVEEVLLWVSEGNTLRSYCRQENKPAYTTIYNWMNKNTDESKDFLERFARAREWGADCIADEILEIVDEMPRMIGEDQQRIDPSFIQEKRVRAEIRLKLLAKWHPQKWSDRTNLEHSGGISLTVNTGVPQQ